MVSIITVCLNSESTINDTIESVLSQSYKEIEYIIIDGGSTDNTLGIVNKYRDRIDIIVSEPDQGLYDAMNKGIRLSSGEIIGIINSDDWYMETAVESVVSVFDSCKDLDIVYGDMLYIEPKKEPYKYEPPEFRTLWRLMPVNHPATFVRKSVYDRYGGYDSSYRIAGDCEAMLRYWLNGLKFGHINSVLSNFRVGGLSCTHRKQNETEGRHIVELYLKGSIFADSFKRCVCDESIPVYLWGAGRWGTFAAKHLVGQGIRIDGIYDIDSAHWGNERYSVEIISPQKAGEVEQTIVIAINRDDIELSNYILPERIKNCSILHIKDIFREYEQLLVEEFGDVIEVERKERCIK